MDEAERKNEVRPQEAQERLHEGYVGQVNSHAFENSPGVENHESQGDKAQNASGVEKHKPPGGKAKPSDDDHNLDGEAKPSDDDHHSGSNSKHLLEDEAKMEETSKVAEQKSAQAHAALKEWEKAKQKSDHAFKQVQQMAKATRQRTTAYFAAREVGTDHSLQEIVDSHDVHERKKLVQSSQDQAHRLFSQRKEAS